MSARKHTTYRNPSLADRMGAGEFNPMQMTGLIRVLEQRGAGNKTLKRLRRALEKRLRDTFNGPPVASWTAFFIRGNSSITFKPKPIKP